MRTAFKACFYRQSQAQAELLALLLVLLLLPLLNFHLHYDEQYAGGKGMVLLIKLKLYGGGWVI